VLTSNVMALDLNMAQYCIIPDENGYAIDDAYLYRFEEERFLLVVNAAITFHIADGVVTAVRGTLLPQLSAGEDTSSMTAVTALTRFLEDCRTTGEVVSAVTDITLCYELQSTASSPMTLSPAWHITAENGDFFVSCATGKVTHN